MSDVTLKDIGPAGRQTIMFRGRQVGYYREATGQVQFAPRHMDKDQQALILSELSHLIGAEPTSVTNPPEEPPPEEAYEELDPDDLTEAA